MKHERHIQLLGSAPMPVELSVTDPALSALACYSGETVEADAVVDVHRSVLTTIAISKIASGETKPPDRITVTADDIVTVFNHASARV